MLFQFVYRCEPHRAFLGNQFKECAAITTAVQRAVSVNGPSKLLKLGGTDRESLAGFTRHTEGKPGTETDGVPQNGR